MAALVILTTIVLPAEYGLDPTRIGGMLGLTEMGEIKMQLHREADERHELQPSADDKSSFVDRILGVLVSRAHANNDSDAASRKETITFTLSPGQGTEIKLTMKQNATAHYLWSVNGGKVNYDLHVDGNGSNKSVSYKKGRGVDGDKGIVKAAFDGDHGWFWRSRNPKDVTITLHVRGDYLGIKRSK